MTRKDVPDGIKFYRHSQLEQNKLRVSSAVDELVGSGSQVSFCSVAEKSGLCRSTLYRNAELREIVECARDKQPKLPSLEELLQRVDALQGKLDSLCNGMVGPTRVEYAEVLLRVSLPLERENQGKMTHLRQ